MVLLASKYETIPAFTNLRFDRPDTSRIANPSAKYHQPVVADMFVLDALHFIECGGAFLRRSLHGRKGESREFVRCEIAATVTDTATLEPV